MNIKIQLRSNHFRKWLRRLGCSLLIGSMLCTQTVPAWATSKAEKEKKEAQQKLDDAKKKAEAAEANKNAANAQVRFLPIFSSSRRISPTRKPTLSRRKSITRLLKKKKKSSMLL